MNSFSKSENKNSFQFLHYTNQLANEEFENDVSSMYEDKEMVNPSDANEFEHEDFNE